MATVPLNPTLTIAEDLEAHRLAHRAARLERAIAALEDRSVWREATLGHTPAPLRAALAGFREELADVRRRLAALGAA